MDKKRTEAHRNADKRYYSLHKVQTITVSFKTDYDQMEYKRLISYLDSVNDNKNAYIKKLIKQDLDSKNIPYPCEF